MLPLYPYISRRSFGALGRSGGINVDYTHLVKTEAVGKSQWEESPYLFANEWIAANIAQFLRLPVPPFAIVRKKTRATAMFILYSYDGDTKPDDVDPALLYENHPHLCTGITLFDILVANCDRYPGNLKVDRPSKPKSCYIIDHERALLYIYKGEGIKRLQSRQGRLGITDRGDSDEEWHCLIDLLDSVEYVKDWLTRIESIPDRFIDEICEETWKVSLTRAEVDEAKLFLKQRRDTLRDLIVANRQRFTSIPADKWPMFL